MATTSPRLKCKSVLDGLRRNAARKASRADERSPSFFSSKPSAKWMSASLGSIRSALLKLSTAPAKSPPPAWFFPMPKKSSAVLQTTGLITRVPLSSTTAREREWLREAARLDVDRSSGCSSRVLEPSSALPPLAVVDWSSSATTHRQPVPSWDFGAVLPSSNCHKTDFSPITRSRSPRAHPYFFAKTSTIPPMPLAFGVGRAPIVPS
mmetsp:Transcript_67429/g.130308  ORF Transcript_67429/g.130308 Transcript_67429/m.130308 type:complete len:208 (-) Transcript_67429:930-1553(-)